MPNVGEMSHGRSACDSMPEPRGPGVFLSGLCVACGRATTERDDDGLPRHRLRFAPPADTCAICREPMTIYETGQTIHPSC